MFVGNHGVGGWKLNTGPLQNQQVLSTAAPSPTPLICFKKKKNYFYLCTGVRLSLCIECCACNVCGGQKRAQDPLELELEVTVSCLM